MYLSNGLLEHNTRYVDRRGAEFSAKLGVGVMTGRVKAPYFRNLAISNSVTSLMPFFIKHVFGIFLCRTKKHMGGVNAQRDVTRVTNVESRRYLSKGQLIRKLMCFWIDTLNSLSACAQSSFRGWNREISVSAPINSANPQPASLSFINFIPKSFHALSIADNVKEVK